jgi:hypothetical protein
MRLVRGAEGAIKLRNVDPEPVRDMPPWDWVCEVRYQANPRLLDIAGNLAGRIFQGFEYTRWSVGDGGSVEVTKGPRKKIFVNHRHCGVSHIGEQSADEFGETASRLLRLLASFPEFGESFPTTRIGIRLRYVTDYSGSFDELLGKVTERSAPVRPGVTGLFDGDLSDYAMYSRFEADGLKYRIELAPVTAEEVAGNFDGHRRAPAVGLMTDVDVFTEPNALLNVREIVSAIKRHASEASRVAAGLAHLICGS